MALQNIGAGNRDDAFYRYKMPKMVTKIEGRGNGIKTNVVNMVDIAKALARPASYTTKYFGCELGAQSKFDEKTGVSLVNGAHDTPKLAGLLENFIKKYVQCYGCGNPETEILITKTQMIQLKCAACGFVSDVDMRDKLTTFILKNPPEQKKGSKDKKAMRRAEKERLKEGEAADEELRKLKKEVKKKGSSTSKDGPTKSLSSKKKANGSDEDRTSPPRSQVDEKEEADYEDDDDDVQWQTDTSLEAARQRIQEQLSAATAEMVMLSTDEPEKKIKPVNNKANGSPKCASPPPEEKPKAENGSSEESNHEMLVEEVKANLKKGVGAKQLQSILASLTGSGQEKPNDFVNYNPSITLQPFYALMRDALNATGRSIVYSVCEWGLQDPARWEPTGNSWRMSNDIADGWGHVVRIINEVFPITGFAGPGGWNDLDMLEVGNSGMTIAEQRTHFAFWAAAKSPLLIGAKLSTISADALAILKNPRLLAVNQDPLGKSIGLQRRYANDKDVWSGPLSDGSTVVIVINWQNSARNMTFNLSDINARSANAVDLWTGSSLGQLTGSYTANVAAHGCFALKLSSVQTIAAPTFTYYNAASSANTLSGGANTHVVNSTTTIVGYVGNGPGTLKFNGIDGGSGGTKLVAFDYIHADWTMSNTACSNCRNAYVSVNGGTAVQVQFPISGMTWDILYSGFKVSLSGFQAGKNNTITITNPTTGAYAPDFYRVGVAN